MPPSEKRWGAPSEWRPLKSYGASGFLITEPVPYTKDGVDVAWVPGIRLQLVAQVVDVDVDGAPSEWRPLKSYGALDAIVDAQVRGLQELHAAEDLHRVLLQDVQQAELGGRERHDLPIDDAALGSARTGATSNTASPKR